MKIEKDQAKVCEVCEEEASDWWSISQCDHKFCQSCCLSYIKSQANNFSEAKCLKEGCNAKLDKSKEVYSRLDPDTVRKIQKFNNYKFLQQNPDLKGCRAKQCGGYFNAKSKKRLCNICQADHCRKCFQLKHDGECKLSKQQQQMRKLNYNKCPKCYVWVEKAAGCQFITCKCGTEFCFTCGVQFYKDPCRKRQLWIQEEEVRQKMSQIVIKPPSDSLSYMLFIPKLALKLILTILATYFFGVLPFLSVFILVGILISVIAPCALCAGIHRSIHVTGLKVLASIVWLIFYPILCCLSLVIYLLIIIAYPFCRRSYHHGIYDPIDKFISKFTKCYLSMIIYIVSI